MSKSSFIFILFFSLSIFLHVSGADLAQGKTEADKTLAQLKDAIDTSVDWVLNQTATFLRDHRTIFDILRLLVSSLGFDTDELVKAVDGASPVLHAGKIALSSLIVSIVFGIVIVISMITLPCSAVVGTCTCCVPLVFNVFVLVGSGIVSLAGIF